MSFIWSPAKKFSTWRKLWLALATAEKELGLDISEEQLKEMSDHIYDIDFEYADEKEKEFRHDVMGHVHAFGKVAPKAMSIIHLGATSCYVGDNTDLIQIRDSLRLLKRKLLQVLSILKSFALKYKQLPCLGFTHYQPAQLTTVGKRCTLWMQDLLLDLERVDREIQDLPMRGVKGTTGTQASFLDLFDGDHEKVKQLNSRVCELMDFKKAIPVSGQTYTRKIDYHVMSLLSGIAQSAYKMCGDIRLLANLKEVEEPFAKTQIGSSAMAYKRNPMRSERVCSLARYVISLPASAAHTHANQWFERTLDDSAIRRVILPEGFLAVDVILTLLANIADGLHVWPNVINAHVMAELPFMATENILMACKFSYFLVLSYFYLCLKLFPLLTSGRFLFGNLGVKAGGDRQALHEAIRVHSMEAGRVVKAEGKPNDLMERIRNDVAFECIHSKLDSMINPIHFVGRAPEQVDDFVLEEIDPILQANFELLNIESADAVNV